MPWHIVLIDFENTQPKDLAALNGLPVKVCVFVGRSQGRISLDLAAAMQQLGENATYVRMADTGRNALDFHIACYLGELAAAVPDAHFFIVSKDKGYDPLIRHLGERELRPVRVYRVHNLAAIPGLDHAMNGAMEPRINTIVTTIVSRTESRPKSVKTLSRSINALFGKRLTSDEIKALLDELNARGHIAIQGTKMTYPPQ